MRTRWSRVRKNCKNGIARLSDHNDNAPANTIWVTPDFQLGEEIEAGHLVKEQPLTKCDGSQKLFRLLRQNIASIDYTTCGGIHSGRAERDSPIELTTS